MPKPTTTPSLRRSPRLHPQTRNPKPLIIPNNSSQKPTKQILVCGLASTGSKKSSKSSNVLGVSNHNKRFDIFNDSDSEFRRSSRFKDMGREGFTVRRSPRFVLNGNDVNIVESSVNCKVNKKRGGSEKPECDKGVIFRGGNGAERSGEGSESGGLIVGFRRELKSDVLSDSLGYELKLIDGVKDCGNDSEVAVGREKKPGEEGEEVGVRGWTKEQETSLQRAYFAAKPTPNFWKKVSKLVPGKSAQDCYDKIHSDHATPLHPLPRSRARKTNLSPIGSLSASKLLDSSGIKTKRPISKKQTSRIVHKTVRQLLQKCNRVEQDYEADLFSALEPTVNPLIQDSQVNAEFSTPKPLQEKQKCLHKCVDKDSDLKKCLSKRSSCRINLVSPPVLKQVKNRALHEKYIDHLHTREAKRNAAAKRAERLGGKENSEQTNIQNVDIVKSAKDALVSDARDGIKQLEHLQAKAIETCSDIDDDCIDSMDDEAECGI